MRPRIEIEGAMKRIAGGFFYGPVRNRTLSVIYALIKLLHG